MGGLGVHGSIRYFLLGMTLDDPKKNRKPVASGQASELRVVYTVMIIHKQMHGSM